MKKVFTLFAVVFMALYGAKAQTVTIGNTSSTLNNFTVGPTHMGTATNVFRYAKHIAIYTAAELQAAGASGNTLIEKIRWDRVVPPTGGYTSSNLEFDVYIKGVSFTQFASTPITWATEVNGATLVYSSDTENINTSAGWQEFILQTPFLWNGTDNIEIFVESHKNSNSVGAAHFRYHTATNASAMTGSTNISTTAARNSTRPNIQFEFVPAQPMSYLSNNVSQVTGNAVRGEVKQAVLQLQINTEGGSNAFALKSLSFATTGTTTTSDISKARIYYTGTSSTYNSNTPFGEINNPSGATTITGSQTLQTGANYFWLAYDVAAGAQAGNVIDGAITSFTIENSNSSATHSPSGNPNGNREVRARLFGSYTVGTGGDYTSLAAAFADVNTIGLENNTTLNIISDLFESNIPALGQRTETGNGGFMLTIRPSAGFYTVSGSQATGLIMLDGADRVTIDGRVGGSGNNLTLINNFSGAAVVRINGPAATAGSNNVTIRNTNIIAGSNTSTTTYGISVLGNDNDDLTIESNSISNASTGIIIRGVSTTATHDRVNVIGNMIGSESTSGYVLLRGIDAQFVGNGLISQNQVINMLPTATTTIAAIELGQNVSNTAVTRNKIHNLRNNSASGGAYGINISTSTGNTNNIIANNFISGISTFGAASSTTNNAFGIRIAGGTGHEVYYNTVNMSGNFGGAAGLSSALLITSGSGINVRNNILSNNNTYTGAGPKAYAIYTSVTSPFVSIDYNNYNVTGNNNGILGYRSGTEATTVEAWRLLTQQDLNSISRVPAFTNVFSGDLHLNVVDTILAKGIAISSQLTDIDGEIRKNTYIGADEVLPAIIITTQPPSLTQCVGSDYVLRSESSVNFNAILSYEWRRNGIPIFDNQTYSGATSPVLTIRSAQPFEAGVYVLKIRSNSGTEIEATYANIIVNSPITIAEEPKSVLACLNENVMFSVPVSGSITGYQWQKAVPGGYMNLPGETAPGFNLNNVNYTTSGKYRLLVFGGCTGFDTVSTREATVFVIPQNNLITEPEDKIAATGTSVSLTAEAFGGPSASFQWYKGAQALADDERISGATSSVLTIDNLQMSDAGTDYSVRIVGKCGTGSSRQITLSVIQPNIFITAQPRGDTVCSGGTTTFTSAAESSIADAELVYSWRKDGVAIENNADIIGATTPTLTINNITDLNAGDYTLEVTTTGGAPAISDAATLIVAATPVISQQPQSAAVCENEVLTLDLAAEAVGAAYQWKLNGADIAGATSVSYVVSSATAADAGLYTVSITNECGQITSAEATVTINTKPAITQQPEPIVNLNQDESFTLTVTAGGSGTLSYQWIKDGVDIAGENQPTYTVANAKRSEHMGKYSVRITNECGNVVSNETTVDIISGINDNDYTQGIILEGNQPNPFSNTTSIRFTLPDAMNARISIMDIYGREIAVLADGFKTAGAHTVVLNASELQLPSGIYMYTLTTGSGYSETKQLVVVK
ncbi:MAG: immunoglobulin domain-containing protein [Bacteroidota bacterium]